MGAWGSGHFENDAACDWVCDLEDYDDLSLVEATIVKAIEAESPDASVACEALAAVEVIARLRGNWGVRNEDSEEVDEWVEAHSGLAVPDALVAQSVQALDAVLDETSELRELWAESDELDEWSAKVLELRVRVQDPRS